MKIINEEYMKCRHCNTEASGLQDINKVFGYQIIKEQLIPFTSCRECREQMDSKEKTSFLHKKDKEWNTATGWGKSINISRAKFESYLIDLGYLERTVTELGEKPVLNITEKGRPHCVVKHYLLGDVILWDYATFAAVTQARIKMADIHLCCTKCKAPLDTAPDFKHTDYSHICSNCGTVCVGGLVDIRFDR